MYLVISESRGLEYASKSKLECENAIKTLKSDDKENGGYKDVYYIEKEESGLEEFYKEGWQ